MSRPRIGDTITTNSGKAFRVVEHDEDLDPPNITDADIVSVEVDNPKRRRVFDPNRLTCIDYDDGIYGEF